MIDQPTIDRIRRATDEPTDATYTDAAIDALWASFGEDFNLTVAEIWDEKAAQSASLVDVTEGQSSRRMSQAHDGAVKMAAHFRARSTDGVPLRRGARTRPIERV